MREIIQQLIQQALIEHSEHIAKLEGELEEVKRCLKNINRVGKIAAISDDNTRIKVKFGDNETPFIKWFSACAGEVAEYRLPSVGEQAVLINVGGGYNSATSIALIGVPSDAFPLPTSDPKEILRVYPDGTRVSYHTENHVLTLNVQGEVNINATGKTNIDAEKIHLNQGSPVVTTAHICHYTGNPHGDGSSTVTAEK